MFVCLLASIHSVFSLQLVCVCLKDDLETQFLVFFSRKEEEQEVIRVLSELPEPPTADFCFAFVLSPFSTSLPYCFADQLRAET
jgi:hypothetical protein